MIYEKAYHHWPNHDELHASEVGQYKQEWIFHLPKSHEKHLVMS